MSYEVGRHPLALAYDAFARRNGGIVRDDNVVHWNRQLASGGFGEIWLGYWPRLGTHVVVKFLRETADSTSRRGFAREVRILQRNFRGFVRVFAADPNAPTPYYIMEYFPAGSIAPWAGNLTRMQLRQIALDASTYLAGLHSAGIAHGDIKPDNFLLDHRGRLRIADPIGAGWGCTRLFAENRGGTPGYWAPEIARGEAISSAADVWSFGATMYHLTTGVRPIDGTPMNLRHSNFHCTPEMVEIVIACCQADRGARPGMADIILLLNGQSWSAIKAQRNAINALIGVGGGLVLVNALAGKTTAG